MEELANALFEHASATCLVGADGKIERANGSWLAAHGATGQQAQGRPYAELAPDHATELASAKDLQQERLLSPHTHRATGPDCFFECRLVPVSLAGAAKVLVFSREVTRQVLAERARRQGGGLLGEEHLAHVRSVIEPMPAGVMVADASGKLVFVNRLVLAEFGGAMAPGTPPEVWRLWVGFRPDGRLYGPDEWPLARALKGEEVFREEIELPRPEGGRLVLSANAAPIRDAEGKITGATLLCFDITERRRQEAEWLRALEEARQQQALLQTVFEADPAGLAIVAGPDLRFQMTNSAYRSYTPRPEIEPTGWRVEEIWPPTIGAVARRYLEMVLAEGEPAEMEFALPLAGSTRHFVCHARRILWNDLPAVLLVHWDTTELTELRQRASEDEREAQMRAAELDALIDAIADGVVVHGPKLEVVRTNRIAERMLGVPESGHAVREMELLAQVERVAGERGVPLMRLAAECLERGAPVLGKVFQLKLRDQPPRWVSVSSAPAVLPDGSLSVISVLSDVTEIRELQEREEELARVLSHDLRAPLSMISGQAQLLRRHPDRQVSALEAILKSCQRMDSMLRDLLFLTGVESGQARPPTEHIGLRGFVLDLKERLGGERLRIDIPEGLPAILTSSDRLERILVNLITNALKYSPPSTEVVVDAGAENGEVTIAVTDRGAGISPEDQGRIFERYFRSRRHGRSEGLGLGLYIVRKLVEAEGGTVSVQSEEGKGSTFRVELPAAGEVTAEPTAPPQP